MEVNTSMWGTGKHLSSAHVKQYSRENISHKMLEHNEKISFKNISLWTMQSIWIWKICSLISITYFPFRVFTNSVLFTSYSIILYHDYLNKRKKYSEKIFNRSSYLGFTNLNVLFTCLFSKISLWTVQLCLRHQFCKFGDML